MRKVTEQACEAFEAGRKFFQNNTMVTGDAMFLFGNRIAFRENGRLYVSMCGYNTNTTRERLNGLTGVSVRCKNFTPYINGVEVSSYGTYEIRGNKVVEV